MANTLNLPFVRFVAQVSAGPARPKSSYLAMMAENEEALKECAWYEASPGEVSLVPHDFTKSSFFSDAYDAFKMTAQFSTATQYETAFAGMAAYRFALPAAYMSGSATLVKVALPISRDRSVRAGVRVVAELSDSTVPSDVWSTVRGEGTGALAETGVLAQEDVTYYVDGSAADETVEISLAGADATKRHYLWVYLTMEDYTDRWTRYNAREARNYAIEGSAMLAGSVAAVTFSASVTPDSDGVELLAGGSSPTWLQPPVMVNAGTSAPPVPDSVIVRETFFTAMIPGSAVKTPLQNAFVLDNPLGEGNPPYLTITILGRALQSVQVVMGGTVITKNVGDSGISGNSFAFAFTIASATYNAIGSVGVLVSDEDETAAEVSISANVYGGTTNIYYSLAPTAIRTFDVAGASEYCIMVALGSGAPVDADICDRADESTRRHESLLIEEETVASPGRKWKVTIGSVEYYVEFDPNTSRVKLTLLGDVLGSWMSTWNPASGSMFDPAASILAGSFPLGLVASVGDFSAAVATFEAGGQPANEELLGRLCRTSRKEAGAMMSAYPTACALADELDVLRPVPRFWRTESDPIGEIVCQPGISVWYYRPDSGSSVSDAITWRGGSAVRIGKVASPVFLQFAFLALRAPSAFGNRLVLTNGSSVQANGFRLRFVAWASPADEWDGSNAFAMASMGSVPSIYRSDGEDSVSWSVDCSGALMPLGTRTMTAKRIGVSTVVDGDIAATAQISIPLVAPVGAGDVVLIAPEVLGFADGVGAASATFGRQAGPAGTDAAQHNYAWARYPENLGWFPRVVGY